MGIKLHCKSIEKIIVYNNIWTGGIAIKGEQMNSDIVNFKNKLNSLFTNMKIRGISKGDRILEIYIQAIFMLSPLYLFNISLFNISIKAELFLFITIITAFTYIILIIKKRTIPRSEKCKLDFWMLGIFLLSIIAMIVKIMSKDFSIEINYETEMIVLTLIITYFLISCVNKSYRYYLQLLPASAVIVYAGVLYHYIFNPQFMKPLELLLANPQNLTSYTILVTSVSILLYCTTKEKGESVFYILISGVGCFLLFLSNNLIGICIIGVLFLLIPVIFVPTAALIKKDMHMFFLFFFILSNMPLVTNYTQWIKVDVTFDIMVSIWIDLFLSVVAICYLQYWEKIPENIDPYRSIMKKLRKAYSFMLKLVGILFLVIFLVGEQSEKIPQSFGTTVFKNFVIKFQQCYTTSNGVFYDALAEYGLMGFILLIVICVLIITGLKVNYKKDNQFSVILTVIAIVFLVQSVFLKQQLTTTPIYVILLTFALFDNKEKRGQLQ